MYEVTAEHENERIKKILAVATVCVMVVKSLYSPVHFEEHLYNCTCIYLGNQSCGSSAMQKSCKSLMFTSTFFFLLLCWRWWRIFPTLPRLLDVGLATSWRLLSCELLLGCGHCSALLLDCGCRSALLLGCGRRLALLLSCGRRLALLLGCGRRSALFLSCGHRSALLLICGHRLDLLWTLLGSSAQLWTLLGPSVDVAQPFCLAVDVALPFCSAVDVTRPFCGNRSALLLGCGNCSDILLGTLSLHIGRNPQSMWRTCKLHCTGQSQESIPQPGDAN
ncbi:uncharacterized protein LOC125140210 [Tachysurus fulvidraco]|uniref:uncharacterized protein LOC125140210 n=1 Tax=Tachysurus fulvidraco TaxID=1234273 RepID=UPI001FF02DA8|nr:uncharacterized protein LOC125140210 [Tachysurus fulvidraco]